METKTIQAMPAGVGMILQSSEYDGAGSYRVQTPDSLWTVMYARMKAQVTKRDIEMSAWEYNQNLRQPGVRANAWYWEAYNAEKAKHRVDYPMPWGHVMFAKSAKRAAKKAALASEVR